MKKRRTESDSIGEISVPADKYWGAQTERSLKYFSIGTERMPQEVIDALILIKKASAKANYTLGKLPEKKAKLIIKACEEILTGDFNDNFPLYVWQTGSGTQTNMNCNEVVANRANELAGQSLGSKSPIHPNNDVNMSQSSNDVFPAAMHISAAREINERLLPVLDAFYKELKSKERTFSEIVKIGRTHLQDAVPITLGQEFSGYAAQVNDAIQRINDAMKYLYRLPLGGTAVGTGLNAPRNFDKYVTDYIKQCLGLPFVPAENKFAEIAAHDAIVNMSGALRTSACAVMKIANDIRWLASGPRCGIGELVIPANEPGSSIMPGKVNPTQCEALTMIATRVIGNDTTITIAGSQGNFELNVYKPVMIYSLLQSVRILSDGISNFTKYLLKGIKADKNKINEYVNNSLMLATALNEHLGYDKAAEIAKYAHAHNISLEQAAVDLKILSEKEFKDIVNPKKMTGE